jgi:hypothetical protein
MERHAPKTVAPPANPLGVARDMRRLKADSSASAAELAEFMKQFRGKRPQEVLGLVAQSGLVRATGLATVATVALMAAFTVIPYAWAKAFPPATKPAKAAAATDSTDAAATPAAGPASTSAQTTPAGDGGAAVTDAEQPDVSPETMERLGIGETKETDPSYNPLEESADDLLNDIK